MLQHERSADRTGGGTIGGFMLRRGQLTTFPERGEITERAAAGQSDPEIAVALGCSIWTVRKWRRRGQHQGRTRLSSQMGRPLSGPLRRLPPGMREAIVQMRQMHPGWGPTTLLAELRVDPRWTDHSLPSRSRIAARLRAEKLTRCSQKLSPLPIAAIQPQGAPHDEWELDAQGSMHVATTGVYSCLNGYDFVRLSLSRAVRHIETQHFAEHLPTRGSTARYSIPSVVLLYQGVPSSLPWTSRCAGSHEKSSLWLLP